MTTKHIEDACESVYQFLHAFPEEQRRGIIKGNTHLTRLAKCFKKRKQIPKTPTSEKVHAQRFGQQISMAMASEFDKSHVVMDANSKVGGATHFSCRYDGMIVSLENKIILPCVVKIVEPAIVSNKMDQDVNINDEIQRIKLLMQHGGSSKCFVEIYGIGETSYAMKKMNYSLHEVLNFDKCAMIRATLDLPRRLALAKQIVEHYMEMHNVHKIVHRDVKPGNILLNHDLSVAVIADFGSIRFANATTHIYRTLDDAKIGCTPGYTAPERLKKAADMKFEEEKMADVFAIAMVVLELVFQVTIPNLSFFHENNTSPQAKDLNIRTLYVGLLDTIAACFSLNPIQRPTLSALQIVIGEAQAISPEMEMKMRYMQSSSWFASAKVDNNAKTELPIARWYARCESKELHDTMAANQEIQWIQHLKQFNNNIYILLHHVLVQQCVLDLPIMSNYELLEFVKTGVNNNCQESICIYAQCLLRGGIAPKNVDLAMTMLDRVSKFKSANYITSTYLGHTGKYDSATFSPELVAYFAQSAEFASVKKAVENNALMYAETLFQYYEFCKFNPKNSNAISRKDAEKLLSTAVSFGYPAAIFERALLCMLKGESMKAAASLRAIVGIDSQAEELYRFAMKHKNLDSRYKLFENAWDNNNAEDQASLGYTFYLGRDLPKNDRLAFKYYYLSHTNNFAYGTINLALCYAAGLEVSQDNEMASELLAPLVQKNSLARYHYANTLVASGKYEQAIEHYNAIADSKFETDNIAMNLQFCKCMLEFEVNENNMDKWHNIMRSQPKLESSAFDDNFVANYLMACIYVKNKNMSLALIHLEKACKFGMVIALHKREDLQAPMELH